ncbi:GATA zinc finger domain-containing protein 7 [Colletotrichum trifolii]|uniref:GATA zinc finger domain-containing protein 7 n=1 Tax=Colletotrichum trifolii TaxID=5466 RepID=A0A4R8QTG7_COLTR|nr:GATA zinc finger domain-containing protein 7 [Colletotrichum trifolii]
MVAGPASAFDDSRSPGLNLASRADAHHIVSALARSNDARSDECDFSRQSPRHLLKRIDAIQRVKQAVEQLDRLSQTSSAVDGSGYPVGRPSAHSSETLAAMRKLCEGIVCDVYSISHPASLTPLEAAGDHHARRPGRCATPSEKLKRPPPKRRLSLEACCSECGCSDTPRWRRGPAGPATLCNVCGLLYAKRRVKQQGVFESAPLLRHQASGR